MVDHFFRELKGKFLSEPVLGGQDFSRSFLRTEASVYVADVVLEEEFADGKHQSCFF